MCCRRAAGGREHQALAQRDRGGLPRSRRAARARTREHAQRGFRRRPPFAERRRPVFTGRRALPQAGCDQSPSSDRVAHRALVGRGRQHRVGLERGRDPGGRGLAGFQPSASCSARRRASSSSETSTSMLRFGMSMWMRSPLRTRPIAPPAAASGEQWPIDRPEVPPGVAAVGQQCAGLAQALDLM